VNDIVFSPDSKLLATASNDGTAKVWSATSGAQLVRFTEQAGDVTSVAFSSDSRFVVTGGSDKVARVWRPTTGEEFAVLRAAEDIESAVFSPDNRAVATASQDGTARLYPCEVCLSIEELRRLAHSRVQSELTLEERAIYLHEQ
jgi:WD40 repeat protein